MSTKLRILGAIDGVNYAGGAFGWQLRRMLMTRNQALQGARLSEESWLSWVRRVATLLAPFGHMVNVECWREPRRLGYQKSAYKQTLVLAGLSRSRRPWRSGVPSQAVPNAPRTVQLSFNLSDYLDPLGVPGSTVVWGQGAVPPEPTNG